MCSILAYCSGQADYERVEGMQPFTLNGNSVVCNGELYRFRKMKERLIEKGYTFMSDSDCEILLPLYEEYGIDMFRFLDAEFALVLYDADRQEYIAARDPIGIRPLYFGRDEKGIPVFASEGICIGGQKSDRNLREDRAIPARTFRCDQCCASGTLGHRMHSS